MANDLHVRVRYNHRYPNKDQRMALEHLQTLIASQIAT